jgi:dTDP-4-amino-4,6-dideoxygalactose transaminase
MSTKKKPESQPEKISFYGNISDWARIELDLNSQTKRAQYLHDSLDKILASGRMVDGDFTRGLEDLMMAEFDRKHAIVVGSGTDALFFALRALATDGNVVLPAFTYRGCLEAVIRAGMQPKYMDVTINFGMDFCTAALEERDNVLMAVHPFGQALDFKVAESFRYKGLKILEDASQSLGAICKGRKVGTLGDISIASLDPTKPWGGIGPGGIILTDDYEYAQIIHKLQWTSTKSVMSELECAAVIHRFLQEKEDSLEELGRKRVAEKYIQDLPKSVRVQGGGLNCHSVWSKMAVLLPMGFESQDLQEHLASKDIESKIHYGYTLPDLENHYTGNPISSVCPNANTISSRIISLPMRPDLTTVEIETICFWVDDFLYSSRVRQEEMEEDGGIIFG